MSGVYIKDLAQKIRKIRGELSVKEFATRLGTTPAYIYALEHGIRTSVSAMFVELLHEKFNVSKEWFLLDKGEMYAARDEMERFKPIPVVAKVPAGYPQEPYTVIEYKSFPDVPPGAKAARVKGESMSPTIRDGDYVIWIETSDYKHNDIVIVADEWGDIMLKRLKVREGEIILVSDNPEYPSFRPNQYYRILGKVIQSVRVTKF